MTVKLIIFLLLCNLLQATERDYTYHVWKTEHGLSHNTVFSVTRGGRGFLWIGTANGLCRFDGRSITVFSGTNTNFRLPGNLLTSLYPTKRGIIAGTYGGGLTEYRNHRFINRFSELESSRVWCIKRDSSNRIWIGTAGKGLYVYDGKITKRHNHKNGLKSWFINDIKFTHSGVMVATDSGVFYTDRKYEKWQYYNITNLPTKKITKLTRDKQGVLWIGTEHGPGYLRSSTGQQIFVPLDILKNEPVGDIVTVEPYIWLASSKGIWRVRKEKNGTVTSELINDTSTLSLYNSGNETIWAGTSQDGLLQIRPVEHIYSSRLLVIPDEFNITCTASGSKETIWTGTDKNGIYRVDRKNISHWKIYRKDSSTPAVTAVEEDKNSCLWIGTDSGLYSKKNDGSVIKSAVTDSHIISMTMIDNSLCFSTAEGTVYSYNIDEGFMDCLHRGTVIRKLISFGDKVLASSPQGLYYLTKNFSPVQLSEQQTGSFATTSSGTGVAATDNRGIIVIKPDLETIQIDRSSGLPSNRVSSVITFRDRILLNTPEGWLMVQESKIDNINSQNAHNLKLIRLKRIEDFNPDTIKPSSGNYIISNDRLIVNNRNSIIETPVPPAVSQKAPSTVILKIESEDGNISAGTRNIVINHSFSELKIHFTGINFDDPVNNRFRYRFSTPASDWKHIKSRSPLVLKNLKPGRYALSISSSGLNGVWEPRGDSISFRIVPPFYHRIWFQIPLIIVVITIMFLLVRYLTRDRDEIAQEIEFASWEDSDLKKKAEIVDMYVLTEKPYLNPQLSRKELAEALNINEKELSHIVNRYWDMNFNNFINWYRVEEAKKRLADPAELQFVILKIAFDSGFNSKSVFNSAFRKNTGLSPSEYRKLNIKLNKKN